MRESEAEAGFTVKPSDRSKEKSRKPYEKRTVRSLTPDQAKSKLLDHAGRGDQEAKELLEQLFPEEATRLSGSKKKSA